MARSEGPKSKARTAVRGGVLGGGDVPLPTSYGVWGSAVSFRRVVAAWCSRNIVGRINEVTLRRARLVLGWVTVFGG